MPEMVDAKNASIEKLKTRAEFLFSSNVATKFGSSGKDREFD